jgi:hypothetical protein
MSSDRRARTSSGDFRAPLIGIPDQSRFRKPIKRLQVIEKLSEEDDGEAAMESVSRYTAR